MGLQCIDNKQEGVWSWSDGTYYGFDDSTIYFSFRDKELVTLFILKWGSKL